MIKTENFSQLIVTTSAELHDWLTIHHGQNDSIWLVTFKAHVIGKCVSREDVLDEILCFGWIDGIRRKLDDDRTMQLLSPRRHQVWAQTYKVRAARLIAANRMRPAGLAAIQEAQQKGLWDVMTKVDALIVPDDLLAALQSRTEAEANFNNCAPSYRRNVLRWLENAKTAPTRQKRVTTIVDLAEIGKKVPQF